MCPTQYFANCLKHNNLILFVISRRSSCANLGLHNGLWSTGLPSPWLTSQSLCPGIDEHFQAEERWRLSGGQVFLFVCFKNQLSLSAKISGVFKMWLLTLFEGQATWIYHFVRRPASMWPPENSFGGYAVIFCSLEAPSFCSNQLSPLVQFQVLTDANDNIIWGPSHLDFPIYAEARLACGLR